MNTGYPAKGTFYGKLPGFLSTTSPGMVIQERGVLLLVNSFDTDVISVGSLASADGGDKR